MIVNSDELVMAGFPIVTNGSLFSPNTEAVLFKEANQFTESHLRYLVRTGTNTRQVK